MFQQISNLLVVASLIMYGSSSFACGQVEVDCSSFLIKIDGQPAEDGNGGKIDCGKDNKTKNGDGKGGGPHSGPIVKDGVDIQSPGMGQQGGGKVFHTPNPDDKSSLPSGANSTKGCVAVSNTVLEKLKNECKGKPLKIVGAGSGGGGGGGSSGGSSSSGGGRQ